MRDLVHQILYDSTVKFDVKNATCVSFPLPSLTISWWSFVSRPVTFNRTGSESRFRSINIGLIYSIFCPLRFSLDRNETQTFKAFSFNQSWNIEWHILIKIICQKLNLSKDWWNDTFYSKPLFTSYKKSKLSVNSKITGNTGIFETTIISLKISELVKELCEDLMFNL